MIQPVRDALDVLNGKWKLPIIIALTFGKKRFSEISREIPAITHRMLSKELREMEMNELLTRTVHNGFPVTIEYNLTDYGRSLDPVIQELGKWGLSHRERIINSHRTAPKTELVKEPEPELQS